MNQFDIIGALRTYAESQGWAFLFGSEWMQNYEASRNEYEDGQLVLGVDFDAVPTRSAGVISEISYNGTMILGRKFDDDNTPANLDETYIQKYDRRLYELSTLMSDFIKAFSCLHELDVTAESMRMDLNKFDTNIDFVANTITFLQ